MKNIIILIITLFSINYSFGQMKVYTGTDVYNMSNLVGKIYSSGQVYKIRNGSEELIGEVKNDKLYINSNYFGRYSDIPTMGGGGKILLYNYGGTNSDVMVGFRDGGRYYYGKDIDDDSTMMGFHIGDFLNGMNGNYVAAFFLIMLYYNE